MVDISLADRTISVTRPKLRKWLLAEELRDKVSESANGKDDSGFVSGIYSFLLALASTTETELDSSAWYDVLESFYKAAVENAPRLDLSVIHAERKKRELPDAWDYKERIWYSWVDSLAHAYGWNIEYISELDVDDALALIQEISLRDQFDREWSYSLSEVAYEYDKSTQKSVLRPLPRPSWMSVGTQAMKEAVEKKITVSVRTPVSFIPKGIIIENGKDNTNELTGDSNPLSNSQ